jgi:hypothetical protein
MRRVARVVLGAVALAGAAGAATPALAVTPADGAASLEFPEGSRAPAAGRFRLGLGTGLALGLSQVEEQSSDTVGSDQSFFRWNLSLAPAYRVSPVWSLGVRGSWSSDAGARSSGEVSVTRTFWQLSADARFQPGGLVGPYLGLGAGQAWAVDNLGSASAVQSAPLLAAAVGHDFGLLEPLALGVELRGGLAFFDSEGASHQARGAERVTYVYGTSSWLSLNLTADLGF